MGRQHKCNEVGSSCLISSVETVQARTHTKKHSFHPNWQHISDKSNVKALAWDANLLHASEHQRGSAATLGIWSSAGFFAAEVSLVASLDSEQTCKNGRHRLYTLLGTFFFLLFLIE